MSLHDSRLTQSGQIAQNQPKTCDPSASGGLLGAEWSENFRMQPPGKGLHADKDYSIMNILSSLRHNTLGNPLKRCALCVVLGWCFVALGCRETVDQAPETMENLPAVQIDCHYRGIYRVTGASLVEAGVDLSAINPSRMSLVHFDKPVPIYTGKMNSRRMRPQDAIYFFAPGAFEDDYPFVNLVADMAPATQTFMLYLDASPFEPLRYQDVEMETPNRRDARNYPMRLFSSKRHFERDAKWHFIEGSGWMKDQTDFLFWKKLTNPETFDGSSLMTTDVALPAVDLRKDIKLNARFFGIATNKQRKPHRVTVVFNDEPIEQFSWIGIEPYQIEVDIPHRIFRNRKNTLTFRLEDLNEDSEAKTGGGGPAQKKRRGTDAIIDQVVLDWYDLTFKRYSEVVDDYCELTIADEDEITNAGQFHIRGFTDERIMVFDLGAREVLQAQAHVNPPNSPYFGVNLTRPPQETTLVAVSQRKCQEPLRMTPVTIKGLFERPNDCDFLILTHPDFEEALEPFVQWKRQSGLNPSVVSIMDVFHEKTGGYGVPSALRDYIHHVYLSQDPQRLKYVLLVGDSATIPKSRSYCPAYSHLFSGQHANDNYFATFHNPWNTPLFAIGRFSARSGEQVGQIVKKIVAYEKGEMSGMWRSRFFIIAASRMWAREHARLLTNKHYKSPYSSRTMKTGDYKPGPEYFEQLNESMINRFELGYLIVTFFGHGGGTVWEVGPTLRHKEFHRHLFDQSHVENLTNDKRLPLVFALTCYTNNFDDPYVQQTLGETFLHSDGGAIAVIGASARSSVSSNYQYIDKFLSKLFAGGQQRLGDLYLEAKKELDNKAVNMEYQLLGDPTLAFGAPRKAIDLSNIKCSPERDALRFDYRIPDDIALPVQLTCMVSDTEDDQGETWTAQVDRHEGSLEYNLEQIQPSAKMLLSVYAPGLPGFDAVGAKAF